MNPRRLWLRCRGFRWASSHEPLLSGAPLWVRWEGGSLLSAKGAGSPSGQRGTVSLWAWVGAGLRVPVLPSLSSSHSLRTGAPGPTVLGAAPPWGLQVAYVLLRIPVWGTVRTWALSSDRPESLANCVTRTSHTFSEPQFPQFQMGKQRTRLIA